MKGGISKYMGPSIILLGQPASDFNMYHPIFGSHILVYIGTKSDMSRMSLPAIALRESNDDGEHFFMSFIFANKFIVMIGLNFQLMTRSYKE